MRFKTGCLMLTLFTTLLALNDVRLIMLSIVSIQAKVFQELRRVKLTPSNVQLENQIISMDWALFIVFTLSMLNTIWYSHLRAFLCFMLYTSWFCSWLISVLNRKHQDILSCYILHASWVHLCILYTLTQPILIYHNINQGGNFWFLFPSILVVCNDIAAYVCGRYFGKTKLLDLSPNKTLEGFLGALVITVVFALLVSTQLYPFNSLVSIYESYKDRQNDYMTLHAVAFALFASLIGPFGGFFASAVKRASGLKDFDDFIPGHGGLSDRVDCQLFMAAFTFVYCRAFVHN